MRVLLIEDEEKIIRVLKPCLKSEYFEVDVAIDGENGSFMARTNDYDLIILDYILPKKDGRQVCSEIRNDGKKVPIIMLTVRSEISEKVDLFNLGVDDYLTKPFSMDELKARIKAILRRPTNIEGEIIQIRDLTVNTGTHVVKKGRREIFLARKEYQLLEYMIKNAGKVLSRGMIIDHVWDMNADPFSNTIESHILNLRKKIGDIDKKIIQTTPGFGYKIKK